MFDTGDVPGSATVLAGLDIAAADDAALIDAMVAAERLASFASSVQLAAIAELFVRRSAEGGGEFAADEVSAALRTSRMAANKRLDLALGLSRLPDTARALRAGAIDVPRARVLVDGCVTLTDVQAGAVEATVLDRAPEQTPGQLNVRVRRAVLGVDPAAAEARHAREVGLRRVTVQVLADGMAELCAILPADQATAVYQTLNRQARAASGTDGRSMDNRRADTLVDLVLGTQTAVDLGARALIQVTVPVSTLRGRDDTPGRLAGYGPIPASMTRRLAVHARWRRLVVDDAGSLVEHGRTSYKPSPQRMARILADPPGNPQLNHGRSTYRPPKALQNYVRARDVTCRFTGCRQPAWRCDLDHTIPHPKGETCPGNLGTLCRHHHRVKHQTRWRVRQSAGAVLTWTSPTGHSYTTRPPPIDDS